MSFVGMSAVSGMSAAARTARSEDVFCCFTGGSPRRELAVLDSVLGSVLEDQHRRGVYHIEDHECRRHHECYKNVEGPNALLAKGTYEDTVLYRLLH